MSAREKIEAVKAGLQEAFDLGPGTDYNRSILPGEFSASVGIVTSQLSGILEILKQDGFIKGYTAAPVYNATATELIKDEIAFVVSFPETFEKDESEGGLPFATITYDLAVREIVYNDQYVLARPRFNSSSHQFFEYVFQNPNRPLASEEIKKYAKSYKGPNQLLSDLKFKGSLRAMFFPGATMEGVLFRNPLTKETFVTLKIPEKKLKSDLSKLRKRKK